MSSVRGHLTQVPWFALRLARRSNPSAYPVADFWKTIASFRLSGYVPGMKVQANSNLAIDIAVNEIPKPAAGNDTLGERLKQMIITVKFVVRMLEEIALEGLRFRPHRPVDAHRRIRADRG